MVITYVCKCSRITFYNSVGNISFSGKSNPNFRRCCNFINFLGYVINFFFLNGKRKGEDNVEEFQSIFNKKLRAYVTLGIWVHLSSENIPSFPHFSRYMYNVITTWICVLSFTSVRGIHLCCIFFSFVSDLLKKQN